MSSSVRHGKNNEALRAVLDPEQTSFVWHIQLTFLTPAFAVQTSGCEDLCPVAQALHFFDVAFQKLPRQPTPTRDNHWNTHCQRFHENPGTAGIVIQGIVTEQANVRGKE